MAAAGTSARAGIFGAVGAALLASACCIGPLAFAALGIGGAGLLLKLAPYRPLFGTLTLGMLGLGFWRTYRTPKVQEGDDCGCELPRAHRAGKIGLWLATVLVVGILLFPNIIALLT